MGVELRVPRSRRLRKGFKGDHVVWVPGRGVRRRESDVEDERVQGGLPKSPVACPQTGVMRGDAPVLFPNEPQPKGKDS